MKTPPNVHTRHHTDQRKNNSKPMMHSTIYSRAMSMFKFKFTFTALCALLTHHCREDIPSLHLHYHKSFWSPVSEIVGTPPFYLAINPFILSGSTESFYDKPSDLHWGRTQSASVTHGSDYLQLLSSCRSTAKLRSNTFGTTVYLRKSSSVA